MRYSISMYRGGFQIDAENCDHTSAKNLGLICPFCKEAVFYRSGSKYSNANKTVTVKPSFVHYAIDGDELTAGIECENRAKRQEGIDYLARLEIESKNQRLKLYNDHLWDMFCGGQKDREKMEELIDFIKKCVPSQYIKLFLERSTKYLRKNCELIKHETIAKYYDFSDDDIATTEYGKEKRLKMLEGVDIKLEKNITLEIFDFLLSKTGQRTLTKLLHFSILMTADTCIEMLILRGESYKISHNKISHQERLMVLNHVIRKVRPLPIIRMGGTEDNRMEFTFYQTPASHLIGKLRESVFSNPSNIWGNVNKYPRCPDHSSIIGIVPAKFNP